MKTTLAGVLIVLAGAMAGAIPTAGATQFTPVAGFRELLKSAETVVAVEILRVDDRATAADGPLILEMKVLAVAKGRVRVGQTLRTWEAAQVAGTYRTGERRLLLLKRQRTIEPYHRKAAWWNLPIGLDVFVEDTALDTLTLDALQEWLDELTAPKPAAPRVEINRHGHRAEVLELDLTLLNSTEQVIRLDPSRVTVSFDAAQRHFIQSIVWDTQEPDGWVTLAPGARRSGTISVRVTVPEEIATLSVMIGHLSLSFPLPRVWVGYVSTEVALKAAQ